MRDSCCLKIEDSPILRLNISIINSKALLNWTRIDAEHYQVEYLDFRKKFNHLNTAPLRELVVQKIMTGHTPPMKNQEYYGWPIKFIKTNNVRTNKIVWEFDDFLSEKGNKTIARTSLKNGDILVTIIGATYDVVGRTAMVDELLLPANINQNIVLIRIDPKKIGRHYVNLFLNSKYWRLCLWSMSRQTEQVNLNCTEVESIEIPIPSVSFQSEIASSVQLAHAEQEKSKSLYAEAEKILLSELGLLDWKPTEGNIDIKTSDEVRLFGRCDAEFFQPKYDELFERLWKFQIKELGDLVDYIKGIEPWTDEYTENDGVPFVRVSDVDIQGIERIEKKVSFRLADEYDGKYSPKKGDILFTKDGTIGICFVVNENIKAVLSSAFLRFQKKEEIESEYLALILNSIISKLQIERLSGGAIIAHLKPSDAMTLKIPILSPVIQSKISSLIISSHEARKHSKELLERAKRAVEVFIEENEERAIYFLNERDLKVSNS